VNSRLNMTILTTLNVSEALMRAAYAESLLEMVGLPEGRPYWSVGYGRTSINTTEVEFANYRQGESDIYFTNVYVDEYSVELIDFDALNTTNNTNITLGTCFVNITIADQFELLANHCTTYNATEDTCLNVTVMDNSTNLTYRACEYEAEILTTPIPTIIETNKYWYVKTFSENLTTSSIQASYQFVSGYHHEGYMNDLNAPLVYTQLEDGTYDFSGPPDEAGVEYNEFLHTWVNKLSYIFENSGNQTSRRRLHQAVPNSTLTAIQDVVVERKDLVYHFVRNVRMKMLSADGSSLVDPHLEIEFASGIEWPWRLTPMQNPSRNGTEIYPIQIGDCHWNFDDIDLEADDLDCMYRGDYLPQTEYLMRSGGYEAPAQAGSASTCLALCKIFSFSACAKFVFKLPTGPCYFLPYEFPWANMDEFAGEYITGPQDCKRNSEVIVDTIDNSCQQEWTLDVYPYPGTCTADGALKMNFEVTCNFFHPEDRTEFCEYNLEGGVEVIEIEIRNSDLCVVIGPSLTVLGRLEFYTDNDRTDLASIYTWGDQCYGRIFIESDYAEIMDTTITKLELPNAQGGRVLFEDGQLTRPGEATVTFVEEASIGANADFSFMVGYWTEAYPLDEVVQYNVSVTVFVRYDPTTSSRRNLQGSRDPSRRNLQGSRDPRRRNLQEREDGEYYTATSTFIVTPPLRTTANPDLLPVSNDVIPTLQPARIHIESSEIAENQTNDFMMYITYALAVFILLLMGLIFYYGYWKTDLVKEIETKI